MKHRRVRKVWKWKFDWREYPIGEECDSEEICARIWRHADNPGHPVLVTITEEWTEPGKVKKKAGKR